MIPRLRSTQFVAFACAAALPALLLAARAGAAPREAPGENASGQATLPAAQQVSVSQFRKTNPGARFLQEGSLITRVYGRAFGSGSDPEETAARFTAANAGLFGAEASDLVPVSRLPDARHTQPLMYQPQTGTYKFTLVYYSQFRGGVPVFRSDLRLLVRNEPGYPLVLAANSLRNLGDFSVDPIALNLPFDPATRTNTGMTSFSPAEKVIWAGVDTQAAEPALAVVFLGENDRTDAGHEKWRFVCDAATGEVLYRESLIHFVDVTGNVQANATPGAKAGICTPEVLFTYPWAKVDIAGGGTVYADGDGNFTIPNPGTGAVTVHSYVDGLYFTIDNRAGAEETLTAVVTPPGPANFVHNQANTNDLVLAQTNIYVSGNTCRDWLLSYNPDFPGVATETGVLTVVNRTDGYCPCNAWSDGSDGSINFCQPGEGCPNTAWQSVLDHEYGHHCIDFTSSGQGAYGEGMGDCFALLPVDDPNIGYGFFGDCGSGLRTAANDCQYRATGCSTCGSEVHDCGNLLSGIVWSIRNQLVLTEPADYLDILSSIVVNSILLHTGSSIDRHIAIDFLTLDDDDGNPANGTPHREEICAGFGEHGIACPPADGRWYVDAGNLPGPGSGTQADPFCRIQDALDAATGDASPPEEILVAGGTYRGEGNKDLDFGGKQIVLRSADGSTSPCIIDCEGNGRGFNFHSGETIGTVVNGFTIRNGSDGGVYCSDSSPMLTNCTISGNTAAFGGGVFCISSSPVLTNCVISGNTARTAGGGVYCESSSPKLTNCILWGDAPEEIYTWSSAPALTYCDVQGGYAGTGNTSLGPDFAFDDDFHLIAGSPCIDAGTNTPPGGLPAQDADGNPRPLDGTGGGSAVADMGVYEFNPAAATIAISPARIEFFIAEGQAGPQAKTVKIRNAGGGMLSWTLSWDASWLQADPPQGEATGEVDTVTLTAEGGALTHGNYSIRLAVADLNAANSPRTVEVVLHVGTTLHVPGEYATIQAAIDAADVPGDEVVVADGTYTGAGNKVLDFRGKTISLRSAGRNAAACIIDCQGSGRGFYFHSGETAAAVVEGFTIRNGNVNDGSPGQSFGGGVYCSGSGPTLVNCAVSGNIAHGYYGNGGGVGCYSASPTLANCTISGNTASAASGISGGYGGGVYCEFYSDPILTNCTITGNMATSPAAASDGGGVYCYSSSPKLTNCILWGDTPQEIHVFSGTPEVTYCDVQGGYVGTGNINLVPGFAFGDDLHLITGSPCIDAGTNTPPGGLQAQDAAGDPRSLDGDGDGTAVVDMGAYEFNPAVPRIAASPRQLVFSADEGQPGPLSESLLIRNGGGGTLNWTLNWDASWLQVDPPQGASTGEEDTVTLMVDVGILAHGTYSATLEVLDPAAPNSPQNVVILVYVTRTLSVPGEYGTIQAAIDAAVNGDSVLVADGVYTGTGNKNLDFGGKAITLRSAGGNAADCIIDCQQSGRGFYFHSGETAAAVVDGFTIRNGLAIDISPGGADGGGVYCYSSSPTFNNCTISDNYVSSFDLLTPGTGGGLQCYYCSPTLTDCTITGNTASAVSEFTRAYGGGVCLYASDPVLTDCTITGNAASSSSSGAGDGGGGITCSLSTPILTNCRITGNSATSSYSRGGGVYCYSSSPVLTGCTISGNSTTACGGGVYLNSSSPTLTDCTIDRNTTSAVDSDAEGAGVYCYSSDPMLLNCAIIRNTAQSYHWGAYGGAVFCYSSSPALIGCAITRNTASSIDQHGALGGGIYCEPPSSPQITNCRISGNTASDGGGVYCSFGCDPALTNCTLTGNTGRGGAVFCWSSSSPQLTNCILWNDASPEIFVYSIATPLVTYCDIQGGYSGTGNVNLAPGFAFDDDFHVMPGSPCIDAGTNTPTGGLPAHDADGGARSIDGDGDGLAVADMGAYEFNPAQPIIAVSPAQIELFAHAGQPGQIPQTLSIRNTGGGALAWTLNWGASWLQASPTQGTSTGEVDTVTLTASAGALPPGTYSTILEVADVAAPNSPKAVTVTLYATNARFVPSEYPTIQAAINASIPGDEILVADGTYTGEGNKNLDFGGKPVHLRSASGNPAACIIDCQGSGRGFYFHSGETAATLVEGFTIRNANVGAESIEGACGGAVYFGHGSSPSLTNCIINGNSASTGADPARGGGIYCGSSSNPTLTNCTISGNTVSSTVNSYAGGGYFTSSSPTLINCTISGNTAPTGVGGGLGCFSSSSPTLINCLISGNSAPMGGGVYCSQSSPRFTNCGINDNSGSSTTTAAGGGGGLSCSTSSRPVLISCTINGNTVSTTSAVASGGGLYCQSSSPTLINCAVRGNTVSSASSTAYGGGIYCYSSSAPTLSNCEISGNRTTSTSSVAFGGGVYCSSSNPTLVNCTISGCSAKSNGGAVHCQSSNPTLTNCILWGDIPQEVSTSSANPVVAYCDVQGGWPGTGNINIDPAFADADGPDDDPNTWQDNDYRPAVASPCNDAGNNGAVPVDTLDLDGDGNTAEPLPFDCAGLPRFTDDPAAADCPYVPGTCGTVPIVDMGAYEYQPPPIILGDLNCDGLVDENDVGPFAMALVDPAGYAAAYPGCDIYRADLNRDLAIDGRDIQGFVDALLGL